jgi:hypothetical protein
MLWVKDPFTPIKLLKVGCLGNAEPLNVEFIMDCSLWIIAPGSAAFHVQLTSTQKVI